MANDTEETGILNAVMDFLENFRRPSAALWTGIDSAGTDEGFLGGVNKGWHLRPGTKELADVIGLEEGKPTDEWMPWLGKEGLRLGANIVGDPLTYLFAPAKAGGILKSGVGIGPALLAAGVPEGRTLAGLAAGATGIPQKIMSGMESSKWYKPLMHEATTQPEFEDIVRGVNREGSMLPIREMADEISPKVAEAMKPFEGRYSLADLYTELEKPGSIPELADVAAIAKPYQNLNDQIFRTRNAMLGKLDLPEKQEIVERGMDFMPRRFDDPTMRRLEYLKQFNPVNSEPGRTIYKWVDPDTGEAVTSKANAYVTKEGKILERSQAGMEEAQSILKSKQFIKDPVEALRIATEGQQGKLNFLDVLSKSMDAGIVSRYDDKSVQAIREAIKSGDKDYIRSLGIEDWREVKLQPGLGQGWFAPKAVANRLENMGGVDDTTIGQFLSKVLDTRVGQGASRLLDIWKKETLFNPGYFTGNAVSGIGQLYAAGMPMYEIPYWLSKAGALQRNGGDLYREFQLRGLTKSGWSGSMEGEGPLSKLLEQSVGDSYGGKYVKKGAQAWDTVKNKGFDLLGARVEDNGKIAMALKALQEDFPDFANMAPEAKAVALDKAVARAQDALINYNNMTPTEQKMAFVFPFIAWQRGLGGLTLEQAFTSPQRFSRQSNFLNTVFDPVDREEKANMDPWARENSPVLGAFGKRFPRDDEGNDQMALLGRYIPQGNIEQLTKRPAETIASMVNPILRAPLEMALNQSQQKGGPIDKLATGFMGPLTAPVTGGDYELASGKTFGASLPAGWQYALEQSPVGRHTRTLNDIARNLGLFEDPAKPATGPTSAAVQTITGSRFYGYDPDKDAKKRKVERDKAMRQVRSNLKWSRMLGDDAKIMHYHAILDEMMDRGTVGFIEGY